MVREECDQGGEKRRPALEREQQQEEKEEEEEKRGEVSRTRRGAVGSAADGEPPPAAADGGLLVGAAASRAAAVGPWSGSLAALALQLVEVLVVGVWWQKPWLGQKGEERMKALVIHWGVARKGLLGEVWVEE